MILKSHREIQMIEENSASKEWSQCKDSGISIGFLEAKLLKAVILNDGKAWQQ